MCRIDPKYPLNLHVIDAARAVRPVAGLAEKERFALANNYSTFKFENRI